MLFLLLNLFFATLLLFLCIAFLTGAPFVPTASKTTKRMAELAKITKDDIVYDLGSGDGRLLFAANSYRPKRIIGIEINPYLVVWTRFQALLKRSTVKVKMGNFWTTPLNDATVVFIYLLPWKMNSLEKKLRQELPKGSRIVSNSFIFPNLKKIDEDTQHHIHVFTI